MLSNSFYDLCCCKFQSLKLLICKPSTWLILIITVSLHSIYINYNTKCVRYVNTDKEETLKSRQISRCILLDEDPMIYSRHHHPPLQKTQNWNVFSKKVVSYSRCRVPERKHDLSHIHHRMDQNKKKYNTLTLFTVCNTEVDMNGSPHCEYSK